MSLFQRIVQVGTPDPTQKYASTWQGKQATDLAMISEARELVALLARHAPRFRKGGLGLPQPKIIANGGGMGASWFDVDEMIADGFPLDWPCHLQLKYDMGFKTEMIEVFDAAFQIGMHGDAGFRGVIVDLERGA